MTVYALLTEKQTFFDANSVELTGGKLFVYLAGTTTKATSYTETDGVTPNSNPITLNSRGEVPNGMYVAGGATYKLVLAPSTDTDPPTSPIWTRDNLAPIGYVAPTTPSSQWESSGATVTRLSGTQFQATGDYTSVFQVNRRIKCVVTAGAGYIVGRVTAASFALGVTSVTCVFDSGSLDTGVNNTIPTVGIISTTDTSFPVVDDAHFLLSGSADRSKLFGWEVDANTTGTTRTRTVFDTSGTEVVAENLMPLHNVGLLVTPNFPSANNLYINLRVGNGNDPTAGNPAFIGFRSSTVGSGTPVVRKVSGALGMAISAGSSLGFGSSETGRIWVYAIDNAGTVELAVSGAPPTAALTSFRRFNDGGVVSTTAEGGAGAADSAFTMYSTTARTNVAFRVLGYIEIQTGATAGNWASSASLVRVATQEMPMSGDIVQRVSSSDGAYATGTSSIPNDDTIPQSGEGTQFMSASISPTSALNLLEIDHQGLYTTNAAGEYMTAALFRDATANSLCCSVSSQNSADPQMQNLFYTDLAASTSSTTFKVRAGTASGANATYFNGWTAGRMRGGVMNSYLRIREVFL